MSEAIQRPVDVLRHQLTQMDGELRSALPSHIKPEKFRRVVLTVVQQQPDLLAADRTTLLAACTKCAADGLIPDGREAALVVFNTKKKDQDGKERWVQAVQYMPMLTGVIKRARNSGEIAGIIVQVVHEADEFIRHPEDFEHPIVHRPPPLGTQRGDIVGAYALAKLKDGTIMHEVMDLEAINKVRSVSRASGGSAWTTWFPEMARKSVFRRLSKYLPMDSEVEDLIHRDDEMYQLEPGTGSNGQTAPANGSGKGTAGLKARLSANDHPAEAASAEEATPEQATTAQAEPVQETANVEFPPMVHREDDPIKQIETMPIEVLSKRGDPTNSIWRKFEMALPPDQRKEAHQAAEARVQTLRAGA